MRLRAVLVIAAVLLSIGLNLYLGYTELTPNEEGRNGIAPDELTVRHRVRKEDPLFDLQYLPARRLSNFKDGFRMPEPLAQGGGRAVMIGDEYSRKLGLMFRIRKTPQGFSTPSVAPSSLGCDAMMRYRAPGRHRQYRSI